MTSPWLPDFYRDPGPPNKIGYGGGWNTRTQRQTEGGVYHDSVGPWSATLGVLHNPNSGVSWPVSVPTAPIWIAGRFWRGFQHYPLWGPDSICWHAGVVGDWDDRTAAIGNFTLVGIEFARPNSNVAAKWTDHQLDQAIHIQTYIDRPEPFELGRNAFEHTWLSATSCPNGRNRWIEFEERMNDMGWSPEDWTRFEKYMGGLMRGTAQAVDTGVLNSLMRKGDPDFKMKNTLRNIRADTEDIQKKIDRHQVGTYVAIQDGPDHPGVYQVFMNPDSAGHVHPTYHHVQGTRDWVIYCNARAVAVTGVEWAKAKASGFARGDPLPKFK